MITIRPTAVLDDKQKQVIYNIQPFTVGMDLEVTRGHSSPLEQLNTIEAFAVKNNCRFSEFKSGNLYDDVDIWIDGEKKRVYCWQQTWSMLLHKGVIVNPPIAAECLFEYINAAGINRKGELIPPSPHIMRDPIDFSARVNGTPNMAFVAKILNRAKASGAGIRFVKQEPKNGCVHIDLEQGL